MTPPSPTRGRSALALTLLFAIGSSACWISESRFGHNNRPTAIRDDNRGSGGGGGRNNGLDPSDLVSRTAIPRVGDLDRQNFKPPAPVFKNTEKGLTLAYEPRKAVNQANDSNSTTSIRLAIPHRSPIGDPGQAATLCAEVVASAPQTLSGRASLRNEVDQLGGILNVHVDGSATTFSIDVRTENWEKALKLLVDAVENRPSRSQVEGVKSRLLAQVEERSINDPIGLAIHQVLTTRVLNSHPLDQLQDLSPELVRNFRKEAYRPVGAVLAVSSPQPHRQVFRRSLRALGKWHADAPNSPATSTIPLQRPPGIHWRTTEDTGSPFERPVEAALLFDLTPLTLPKTVEFHVALELFAAGPGSRFARRLSKRLGYDVPIRTQWIENGPSELFAVRMIVRSPSVIGEIRTALDESLQALTVSGPSSDEVGKAAARVRLRFLRDQDQPERSMTVLLRETMLNRRITAELFTTPFAELDSGIKLDIENAIGILGTFPPTVVVAGGQPPESLKSETSLLGTVVARSEGSVYSSSREEQRLLATPYLELAMNAVGGESPLKDFDAFYGASVTETGRGPRSVQLAAFDDTSRRYRTLRWVLETRIDTLLEPDSASEQVGSQSVDLTNAEAKAILNRVERHPLRILASVARGDTKFRLLSVRRHNGRQLAILEREEAGSSRLRMHIDSVSGLVRVLEFTEQRPGIGATSLVEEFRDYRNVQGGLRAPFIVTQRLEGSDFGSRTQWLQFTPKKPEEVYFDRSQDIPRPNLSGSGPK